MKIRKNIWTIAASILVASSCSGFLTEKPKSLFTPDNAIVDEAGLKAAVVGIYGGMIDLFVINTNTPIFLSMLGTDELCYRSNNTNVRSIVDRYAYSPSEGCIGELWARYYVIIARANIVIDAARRLSDLPESVRRQCEGEARFLRAYSYFQLVQFFGDVPIVTEPVTEFDYTLGRSPINKVYDLIIDDLTFATGDNVLPVEIKDGHATFWAAMTLLGKVYLTMASSKEAGIIDGYAHIEESVEILYQTAYDILDEVIADSGRDLLPVYSDVFRIENKNVNQESIWEIQFSSEEPYGTQWAKEMGLTNAGYSGTAGGWRYCAIGGQYSLNAIPTLRGYYKSWTQDVRKNWNICDSLIRYDATTGAPVSIEHIIGLSGIPVGDDEKTVLTNNSNTTLVTRSSATKYRWGDNWKKDYPINYLYSNCPNNIIVLRFADVLLMFTEADMKLNGGKASKRGLNAINRIVQRARGLDENGNRIPPVDTPELPNYTEESLTFEELMKERARELCFEFWRRHDLVRTGMLEYFLNEVRQGNKYDDYHDQADAANLATNFDPGKNYLLPIPQYEIDNSRNKEGMYQNPKY